jgi:hypothetical protein
MPDPNPQKDESDNPPGERSQASEKKHPLGPGEPSPGLKDKEAPTSDSYGNTRDSGDPASR